MKILCFGDSNTYGYDPRSFLGDRYSSNVRWVDRFARHTGYEVYNGGQNGRMIPARAYNLPTTDMCIVMLGTNDLLQGFSAEEVTMRMRAFLTSAVIQFNKILLITPPIMKIGAWVPNDSLVEESMKLATLYEALAKELDIDFADSGLWNIDITFDGVHFSERGHQAFFEGLISVFFTLMC